MKNCILLCAYGFAGGSRVQTTSRSIERMALLSVENSSCLIIPGLNLLLLLLLPPYLTPGDFTSRIFYREYIFQLSSVKNVKERKKEVTERDTDVMLDVLRHMWEGLGY